MSETYLRRNDIEFYDAMHQNSVPLQARLLSWDRQSLLVHMVPSDSRKVLVVGCGSLGEMRVLPGDAWGVGLDISHTAVEYSRTQYPHHDYLLADAACLPLRESAFDLIICSEVLEHVRPAGQALSEFHRLVRDEGCLVLTTPNWWSFYGLARWLGRLILRRDLTSSDQPYDHWYTPVGLKRSLQDAGFEPRLWLGHWFFPPFGKGRYRLPDVVAVPLIRALLPLDRLLRRRFAAFGHTIAVVSCKGS